MKCPKCNYERRPTDTAPDWQCPSCQVAYVKAAHLAAPAADGIPDDAGAEYYERLDAAASGQRLCIVAILLNIGLGGMTSGHAASAGVTYFVAVAIAMLSLVGIVRMCSGLGYTQGRKIFCMCMAFVPLANVVTLVVLSVKATRLLRQAGWRVGLFGARP